MTFKEYYYKLDRLNRIEIKSQIIRRLEVPQNVSDLLNITKESNLLILNIVLIQTPIEDSIVNFIGPLIFNTDTNKAAQIIISDSPEYSVAEKISSFLKK